MVPPYTPKAETFFWGSGEWGGGLISVIAPCVIWRKALALKNQEKSQNLVQFQCNKPIDMCCSCLINEWALLRILQPVKVMPSLVSGKSQQFQKVSAVCNDLSKIMHISAVSRGSLSRKLIFDDWKPKSLILIAFRQHGRPRSYTACEIWCSFVVQFLENAVGIQGDVQSGAIAAMLDSAVVAIAGFHCPGRWSAFDWSGCCTSNCF